MLKKLSDLFALITRDANASSAQAKLIYLEKEYLLDLQALKAEHKAEHTINIPPVPLPIFQRKSIQNKPVHNRPKPTELHIACLFSSPTCYFELVAGRDHTIKPIP